MEWYESVWTISVYNKSLNELLSDAPDSPSQTLSLQSTDPAWMLSPWIMQLDFLLSPWSDFSNRYRFHAPSLFICLSHVSWFSSRLFHASLWPVSRQSSKRVWTFSTGWFQFFRLPIYNAATILASISTLLSFRIKILSQHRSHLPKSSTFPSHLFLLVIWILINISPTTPNIHNFLSCCMLGN